MMNKLTVKKDVHIIRIVGESVYNPRSRMIDTPHFDIPISEADNLIKLLQEAINAAV